jgi:hypothetical protein
MCKSFQVFVLSVLLLLPASTAAHAVVLYGLNFDDSAFSDSATHVFGDINYLGFSRDGLPITGDDDTDLSTALNGPDLYAHIEGLGDSSTKSPYVVDVEFLDNTIFNGLGPDLVLWERGLAEPVGVAVYDPRIMSFTSRIQFASVRVGDLPGSVDVTPGVNTASVNFDSWGLPAGLEINRIRIYGGNGGDPSADIAAIGGLNSRFVSQSVIPEPTTLFLLGSSLFGLAVRRKILP